MKKYLLFYYIDISFSAKINFFKKKSKFYIKLFIFNTYMQFYIIILKYIFFFRKERPFEGSCSFFIAQNTKDKEQCLVPF